MSSPTITCSRCGAVVPAGARYCPECGTQLDAPDRVRTYGTPPSVPPGVGRRLSALRLRSRAFLEAMSAQAAARRELTALRYELEQLHATREQWLRDLGRAVYGGDDAGTERGKAAIRDLDEEIAAKEERMAQTALQAQEHVAQVRAEARPTVLLEQPPTFPSPVPEPYPPPDEGTPPTPAPIPEPYPPPDEGDPPQPA